MRLGRNNLHGYQETAVSKIIECEKSLLFLDMGLGKTVSTLTALNTLMYEHIEVNVALIIAPKRVIESVWEAEAGKWEHLNHLKFSRVTGTEKHRLAALRKKADIYLISRDNVVWLCGKYGYSKLPFDMIVFDELSSFKNPNSARFKAIKKCTPGVSRIVGLTGTPAPNGLLDLWSQVYLLDSGERLGKYIGQYRHNYFKIDKQISNVVSTYKPQDGASARISEAIKDITISMSAEDFLDMPEKITNVIQLDMPKEAREYYNKMKKDLVLELFPDYEQGQTISAANAAALSNKLLQMANGAVYDENREVHEIHSEKLEALADIMEAATGKPVLVAWTYKHDRDRIMKYFKKYKPVQLQNDSDVVNWNAGKYEMMLMHPASGGHGLNLQSGGSIIVWFGQTWSLELLQQFNARLYRQGQKNIVVINQLVMRGTMDESVILAQSSKDEEQTGLLTAVKELLDSYVS